MIDYKAAGVDVEAGYAAVKLMKEHTRSTFSDRVLGDLGSFGGFFSVAGLGGQDPVMVAGTDGVGTKLKLAFVMDIHDTVGIDCVAMCVNDIVCQGAAPLIFLDYLATGKLVPEKAAQIVKGVADGCRQAGCALIGGETAEMPGFYPEGEYDLAGFAVGLVDRPKIVDGRGIQPGDALVGLSSTGVHSNGFSLVRRLVGEDYAKLSAHSDELGGSLGEALLTPTRIYVKTVLELLKQHSIKGMAHITGGGFIENIPRMLPEGCSAAIQLGSWNMPPVFPMLTSLGGLDTRSAYNTFNMGIGMVLAVPAQEADAVAAAARDLGQPAFVIGEVVEGGREVELR